MSGLLAVVGLLGVLAALAGLARGGLPWPALRTRAACARTAAAALGLLLLGGALAPAAPPAVEQVAQERPPRTTPAPTATADDASTPTPATARPVAAAPAPSAPPPPTRTPARAPVAPLLALAPGGDGDSWRDTAGVEYRLGMVDAPETDECGGAAATAYRLRALAAGFRAQVYARDRYGRGVAVVQSASGADLNVAMARDGMVDDRYLAPFRHENPALAARLDAAFAEARAAGRGLWTSCAAPAAEPQDSPVAPPPQPVADGRCHPAYEPCVALAGDGSGRGAANDLDCGDIGHAVRLREPGRDPYRLDGADQDSVGCE